MSENAPGTSSRGSSKSAATRHLVGLTQKKVEEYQNRGLDDVELPDLMLDGLEVAGPRLSWPSESRLMGRKCRWHYSAPRRAVSVRSRHVSFKTTLSDPLEAQCCGDQGGSDGVQKGRRDIENRRATALA